MVKELGYGIVVLWLKCWATESCVMVKAFGFEIVVLWLKRWATESWCYG